MYGSYMDDEDIQLLEEFIQVNDNFDCQECGFNQKRRRTSVKESIN